MYLPNKVASHSEHEPLQLAWAVSVAAHPDVVNSWLSLPYLLQVSAFEASVECHHLICFVDFVCKVCSHSFNLFQVKVGYGIRAHFFVRLLRLRPLQQAISNRRCLLHPDELSNLFEVGGQSWNLFAPEYEVFVLRPLVDLVVEQLIIL
jgi:hypothetical protein